MMSLSMARTILEQARAATGPLSQGLLEALHVALKGDSPELRRTAAEALFYGGNDTSVPHIEDAIGRERDPGVQEALDVAFIRRVPQAWTPNAEGVRRVLGCWPRWLVGAFEDFDLARHLLNWCRPREKKLHLSGPAESDIMALPCFALVVDRDFVGRYMWDCYCEHCDDVNEPLPPEVLEELKEETGDENYDPGGEDTPVIIVDRPLDESRVEWPRIPESKAECIYWVEKTNIGRITALLDRVLEEKDI